MNHTTTLNTQPQSSYMVVKYGLQAQICTASTHTHMLQAACTTEIYACNAERPDNHL